MFQRFAAGSAMGAFVVALAGLSLVSMPGVALQRTWLLTTLWCFVPFAWGVWAMLTPRVWLPERLPFWGAILGFAGGVTGTFVLNLPSRVFEMTLTLAGRLMAVAIITVLYYFLWMLVRGAYHSLAPAKPIAETAAGGAQLKKAA